MATIEVRAAVYRGDNGDRLGIEQLQLADPEHGEVRVRVRAAGVCGSDRHVIDGEWQVPLPAVMGHEAAGVVEAIGAGVRELAVGDHVIIAWHQACQRCAECTGASPGPARACAPTTRSCPMAPPGGTPQMEQPPGRTLRSAR
ncbi:alcohol dehydrogenase catalytic domain-containing protein [Leucobacter luti]|uniref:alcohol dehydrogenase catalytic domain-containing protein n=1 Tax=Leucobacter luti TaxID=340320 RepID=UPI00215D6E3D|nr:alcohol dehydrogenase catalytic domain-containing protein [Leucobacter luti]